MNLGKYFREYSVLFFLSTVFICCLPILFTSYNRIDLSSSTASNIGGAIGGIMGPFVAIAAAFLTFLAFWVQYQANQRLIIDTGIQRFENRFFEMIRIHRDNASIINRHNSESRQDYFVRMFFELRFVYHYINNLSFFLKKDLADEVIFNIAYTVFYYGANVDTIRVKNPLMKSNTPYYEVFSRAVSDLINMKAQYKLIKDRIPETEEKEYDWDNGLGFVDCSNERYCFMKSNSYLSLKTGNREKPEIPVIFWLLREPFTGHINELSAYFEHLLQSVKYLDKQPSSTFALNKEQEGLFNVPAVKYEYFKLLRAQFSTYELLILYYYAVSVFGKEWIESVDNDEDGLLIKYRILKKLPVYHADFYGSPVDRLKNIRISKRNNLTVAMFDEFGLAEEMERLYDETKIKIPQG